MTMTEKIKDTVRLSMGTILVFLSILSTTVMGFQYVKSLAEDNRDDFTEHKTVDEKKWDKMQVRVDGHDVSINQLQLDTQKNTQYYMELIRILGEMKTDNTSEFDKLNIKIDMFEVE